MNRRVSEPPGTRPEERTPGAERGLAWDDIMRSEAHEILERALSLPEADRLLVARTLLESIHQEHDDTVADAWRDDVLRHVAEVHRGDVATEPWSKVRVALCALCVAADGALEGFEFSNQTR